MPASCETPSRCVTRGTEMSAERDAGGGPGRTPGTWLRPPPLCLLDGKQAMSRSTGLRPRPVPDGPLRLPEQAPPPN